MQKEAERKLREQEEYERELENRKEQD